MRRIKKNLIIAVVVFIVITACISIFKPRKFKQTLQPQMQQEESEIFHARNILPILLKNYQELMEDMRTLNSTLSKINQNVSISKLINKTNRKRMSLIGNINFNIGNISSEKAEPSYEVHAFYYPWYGNPEHDGEYYHWNHQFIQHWKKEEAKKWPSGRHSPPDDVGANFYPALGAYSSSDEEVIDVHMQMMRYAKIGVVVVSWYPPGDADTEGNQPDSLMPLILNSAQKYGLKVYIVDTYFQSYHHTWPIMDRGRPKTAR